MLDGRLFGYRKTVDIRMWKFHNKEDLRHPVRVGRKEPLDVVDSTSGKIKTIQAIKR